MWTTSMSSAAMSSSGEAAERSAPSSPAAALALSGGGGGDRGQVSAGEPYGASMDAADEAAAHDPDAKVVSRHRRDRIPNLVQIVKQKLSTHGSKMAELVRSHAVLWSNDEAPATFSA